jgi:pimeloyl-ACP methyl ester carboxylesterase
MSSNPWNEGTVEVNGITLHYHRTGKGEGKPQIVALHGMTENGLSWTSVARALEPDFDIIMPDARGHGKSIAPSMDFTLTAVADDVAGLIRALGLQRPMLLGHSMGGQTATVVAGRYPELVSKLMLEDPAYPVQKLVFLSKILVPLFLRGWKKNDEKTPEQLRLEGKKQNPTWSDEEIGLWINGEKAFARNLKTIKLKKVDLKMDWKSVFPRITCPVLLIIPSHGILRLKAANKLKPEFSGTTVEIAYIENARHGIHREQYEKYMDAVKKFCTG